MNRDQIGVSCKAQPAKIRGMNKKLAVETLKRRGFLPRLSTPLTHFANVNSRKPVWWLEIPRDEVFDLAQPDVHLVLADPDSTLHYLCVPKEWVIKNIKEFAIRKDKDVISLELSALPQNQFSDVRPRSGRLSFVQFLK